MSQATLFVTTTNQDDGSVLRFVLQRPNQMNATLIRDGSTPLSSDLRKQIHESLEKFAACLAGAHADEPSLRELGQVLFAVLLPQALHAELEQLRQPLAIVTDDPTLPWEMLHDDTEFLSLKLPVSRQLLFHQQMGSVISPPPPDRSDFAALIIADPLGDLPGAREEGRALHKLFSPHGPCELLEGSDATWTKIQLGLNRRPYSVIHYCGHMDYDPVHKTSTIHFQGGGRLSSNQVVSTFRGNPIVVLNACKSDAQTSGGVPTMESFGRAESFARAFMLGSARGVAVAVLGTMWLVPDQPHHAGREMMRAFYCSLLEGGSLAESMLKCRKLARDEHWGPMAWGPYVLYGDPCRAPFASGDEDKWARRVDEQRAQTAQGSFTRGMRTVQPPPTATPRQPTAPPQAEPPPAPQPAPSGGERSLDDSARQVMHLALNGMTQMGHKGLGSLHLLMGLCEAHVPLLEEFADEIDLDASCIAVKARKICQRQGWDESGISKTVLTTLEQARERARSRNRDSISADDLLSCLLQIKSCGAVQVVRSFGFSATTLVERLNQPDPLAAWTFDEQAKKRIAFAARRARRHGRTDIGTPHLLMGLIGAEGSWSGSFLSSQGVDTERLVRHLDRLVNTKSGKTWHGPLILRERCEAVLRSAAEAARDRQAEAISERDLLWAVLHHQEGATYEVLCKLGADPANLLVELTCAR